MARYASEGVRVALVCCTGGEAGDILNPRMDRPGVKERLAELRREELETACSILGVSRIHWLGYRDSGMPGTPDNAHPDAFCNAPFDRVVARLVRVIREERPHVVLGYDHPVGYEHPDHIRVHEAGLEAVHAAADPDRYPEAGVPWQVAKVYYFATFTYERFRVLHEAALAAGIASPYEERLQRWSEQGVPDPRIDARIDVSDHLHLRTKALLAHATQIDPDSSWFAIPDELQREAYPWEDYTLAFSAVPVDPPEDDLFAGIEPEA